MPAAVILAGGRGERLGGAVKSELLVGGRRLLDRVLARLGGCEPLLAAHGRLDPKLLRLPTGIIPIPDLPGDYAGPLAGVAAAVAELSALPAPPALLVSVAVDTPFLPEDFVTRLLAGLGDADAAIAGYAGQPYPTNAVWRLAAFAGLAADIAAGTAPHSLRRLGAAVGARLVEWPETAAGDPFANANTPQELAAFEARARRDTLPSG